MKINALLAALGAAVIAMAACEKDPSGKGPEASGDKNLAGETVSVGEISGISKVFVLNEGGFGANNSTLDFLRPGEGKYVHNAYSQMNPKITLGLGDVGNDIAVNGDLVWIVVNNSGIVEVISAKDETHVVSISVASPRNIAFDGDYAYVSSWGSPTGLVHKINTKTFEEVASVAVGREPEGLAVWSGKLYVANSGGMSEVMENTLSVIDLASFKVVDTIEIAVNPKSVFADGKGNIYVSVFGDYFSVHSGLYRLEIGSGKVTRMGAGEAHNANVSVSAAAGGRIYAIGTDDEWNWDATAVKKYYLWTSDGSLSLDIDAAAPYGLAAFEDGGTLKALLIADAIDYFNPGTVSYYAGEGPSRVWSVTAGVCPAHFAAY